LTDPEKIMASIPETHTNATYKRNTEEIQSNHIKDADLIDDLADPLADLEEIMANIPEAHINAIHAVETEEIQVNYANDLIDKLAYPLTDPEKIMASIPETHTNATYKRNTGEIQSNHIKDADPIDDLADPLADLEEIMANIPEAHINSIHEANTEETQANHVKDADLIGDLANPLANPHLGNDDALPLTDHPRRGNRGGKRRAHQARMVLTAAGESEKAPRTSLKIIMNIPEAHINAIHKGNTEEIQTNHVKNADLLDALADPLADFGEITANTPEAHSNAIHEGNTEEIQAYHNADEDNGKTRDIRLPLASIEEIKRFTQKWKLNFNAAAALTTMDDNLRRRIIRRFQPRPDTLSNNTLFHAFIKTFR